MSTIFMKDPQGESFGKISHTYRVWKVYKHRFSENTELAERRTFFNTHIQYTCSSSCTHTLHCMVT